MSDTTSKRMTHYQYQKMREDEKGVIEKNYDRLLGLKPLQLKPETQSQSKFKTEPQSENKIKPEPQSEIKIKPEPDSEIKIKPEPQSKNKIKQEPKFKPEPQTQNFAKPPIPKPSKEKSFQNNVYKQSPSFDIKSKKQKVTSPISVRNDENVSKSHKKVEIKRKSQTNMKRILSPQASKASRESMNSSRQQQKFFMQSPSSILRVNKSGVQQPFQKPEFVRKPIVYFRNSNIRQLIKKYYFTYSSIRVHQCFRQNFDKQLKERAMEKQDKQFVQQMSSLFTKSTLNRKKSKVKQVKDWVRPAKYYFMKRIELLKCIDPNDILIGYFRSQKLLSVCSALAEKPEFIQNLFQDQCYNGLGLYFVRLFVNGVWRYVIIDDMFPIDQMNTPLVSTCLDFNQIQLWPMLIQKAVAKVYGCYQQIYNEHLKLEKCLQLLTGSPIQIRSAMKAGIVQQIMECVRKGYIVMAVAFQNSYVFGLPQDYGFTILGIDEENRIVLRNPWGFVSFRMQLKGDDKGLIRISLAQFRRIFQYICTTLTTYYTYSSSMYLRQGQSVIKLSIRQTSSYYINFYSQTQQNNMFILFKITEDNQLEIVNQAYYHMLKGELLPASYILWSYGQKGNVVFWTSQHIKLKQQSYQWNNKIFDSLGRYAQQFQINPKGAFNQYSYCNFKQGLAIVTHVNKSAREVTEKLKVSNNRKVIRKILGNFSESKGDLIVKMGSNQSNSLVFLLDEQGSQLVRHGIQKLFN